MIAAAILRDHAGRFAPLPRIPWRSRLRYLPGLDPTPPDWHLPALGPLDPRIPQQQFLPGLAAGQPEQTQP